ncbi:MAG: hypothetical protein M3Y59_05195 [Myxococcota bacterium]|nr:hypothetical protein [Myxococcota bacterium]
MKDDFPFLADPASLESSARLGDCLQSLPPGQAMEAAAALYGVFFTLVAGFIGERLTLQLLRSAWPTLLLLNSTERDA